MTTIILALSGIASAVALLGGLWLSYRDSQVHSKLPIALALVLVAVYWIAVFIIK